MDARTEPGAPGPGAPEPDAPGPDAPQPRTPDHGARGLDAAGGRHRTLRLSCGLTHWWEYGDAGATATAVLVHGFRGDHHGLEPLAAALLRFLPHPVRIAIPDLPGFGRSPACRDGSSLAAYAGWLRRFSTAIAGPGMQLLVGHSFGSVVAAAASVPGPGDQSPDADGADTLRADIHRADIHSADTQRPDVRSPGARRADAAGPGPWAARLLALVNPIGAPALTGPRRIGTAAAIGYYRLAARLPARPGLALLRSPLIVRAMSAAMAKTRDPALRRWIHDQHRRYFSVFQDRESLLAAFNASVTNDVSMFAARIAAPTLLIAADRDDITPLAAQRRLQRLFLDARLTVIHGAGHLVHYEAPELAARAIARFAAREYAAPQPAAGARRHGAATQDEAATPGGAAQPGVTR